LARCTHFRGRLLAGLATATLLVVCSNGTAFAAPEANDEPLFYPLPPNLPRLQFLASFSSVLDVSAKKRGFRDFVFGGEDKENHLVNKPYGLAIFEGAVYVIDTRGNGWGVFDVARGKSRFVRPTGGGTLKKPINITIDGDGMRYVTDTGREQVLVYDRDDHFVSAFGAPGQYRPVDVAIVGDRLYVTDIMHHQVQVLDKQTGRIVDTIGEAGSGPGQIFQPTNLAVGPDDTLYVSDTGNFRIQQFGLDGEFIREIGQIGTSPGQFARPKGIAVDHEDRIFVVDAAFNNVQILDPLGLALMFFGKPGNERDSLSLPTVVKIDYENVQYFEKYFAPEFEVEFLVAVANQFGGNKVVVFGFGSLRE